MPFAVTAEDEPPDVFNAILMNDPTINNSISIQPQWQHAVGSRQLGLGWELDKAISPNMQLAVGSGYVTENTVGEGNKNGFGNTDISLGYVFFQRSEFQTMLIPSVSLRDGLGISDPETAGLAISAGGRLAMFDESLPLPVALRAIQFDMDMGSHVALSAGSNDVYADTQIAYSLPYFEFASKTELPPFVRQLNPFLMVNFNQSTSGNAASQPSLYVTPGVTFQTETYQVSTAAQVPTNSVASNSQEIGLTLAIIVYLDKLDSRFAATLFQ